jgi:copper resistance protein C
MYWLRVVLYTLVFAAGLLSPGSVLAHPTLLASRPEAEAVTGPTSQIELRFSERLEQKFQTVNITGPNGKSAKVYRLEVDAATPTRLSIYCEPLAVGRYHVTWRVLSRDGHFGSGNFFFSVRP